MKVRIILFFLLVIFIFFWTNPTIQRQGSIKIWDRSHVLLFESLTNTGRKLPVSYDHFPKHLIDATVASEDNTFWSNRGIDIKALVRAVFQNLQQGTIVSGASTITQQVARLGVISPGASSRRSFLRKIREILIALCLSSQYSKKEIITLYLNEVYYGNLAYGIQAAAATYFHKDAGQLSLAESTFLTGLISSPEARDPYTHLASAKKAQTNVLDLMVRNEFISHREANHAKQEEIKLESPDSTIQAPHFVHYILEELERLKIQNNEGINVYTTLDYPTYQLSEDIARLWIHKLQNEHDASNASLILLENETGAILNMLGGIDYFDATRSGQVNMTTALRQPGSALKPVTYAAAFMKGYTPATLLYDVKRVYKTKKGEGFTPYNYDGRFHGLVLAREALASSFNVPAIEMLNRVGIQDFLKTARQLGINTYTQEERYDLSITLGGAEVTLLDLTNVFASLGRGGIFKPPYAIKKVVTDSGAPIYKYTSEPGQIALGKNSRQIAYLLSDILSDAKARIPGFGEKNPLVLSNPAAVKTGTTTDWHDNWTIGYTPSYTVGVWIGNNDNHPMKQITGVTGAAPIWNQFFGEYLKGKPIEEFYQPEGIKKVEICKISGLLPDTLCQEKMREKFITGTEPKEKSHLHVKVPIDTRNGLRAGSTCPSEFVQTVVVINYPPELYSWAVEDGQKVLPRQFSPLCRSYQQNSDALYVYIVYPKEKSLFESAPLIVTDQAIVFEVNISSAIEEVEWYVDDKRIGVSTQFPFDFSWKPIIGNHTVKAVGISSTQKKKESQLVHFSVVDYKAGND